MFNIDVAKFSEQSVASSSSGRYVLIVSKMSRFVEPTLLKRLELCVGYVFCLCLIC